MDFIFIHINKTGGSSIEAALELKKEHKTAQQKIAEMGFEQWKKHFSFAVVRNPWDKVVSHYFWRVKTNQTGLAAQTVDFNQWVKLAYGEKDPYYYDQPMMFMPQLDWISNEAGDVLVDFVARFENIESDFSLICEKIDQQRSLPHLQKSGRGAFQQYYNRESRDIIAQWFKKDIEKFAYHFEQ